MLYWHFGQKRTGTTSLQTALVAHGDRLARAGIIYPHEWRTDDLAGYSAHHGLERVFEAPSEGSAACHFRECLASYVDSTIFISSEFASDWLIGSRCVSFLDVIARSQSVTPVTGVWVLRRLDEQINSLQLRRALLGLDRVIPTLDDIPRLKSLFASMFEGMRRVEEAMDGRAVYLKYHPSGAHNGEILSLLPLPEELREAVVSGLERGPRLNSQLSSKGVVVLHHHRTVAERLGTKATAADIQLALFLGEFRFEDDEPCELLGADVRQAIQECALAAAEEQGMRQYTSFFDGEESEARPESVLNLDALTASDLERFGRYLQSIEGTTVDQLVRKAYA